MTRIEWMVGAAVAAWVVGAVVYASWLKHEAHKARREMTLSWMKDDHIDHWTPQRAQQAERKMLIAEGRVIEPSYLWSAVAQQHEAAAAVNRERASRREA